MTKRRIGRVILLTSTVFATMASTPSFGQTATPDPDQPIGSQLAQPTVTEASATPSPSGEGGDIIVTAQRRTQRLQDVPISIAVTSGESIQKAGTTDLLDLSTRLPAVHIGTGPQSNNIHIRGVGSGLNAGFEQSVGVFLDGVYRARSRGTQSGLFDVERVEVLNGPQTTFFGNNTVAGAINITSKKPSRAFGYDAQALFSPSDDQYVLQAGITGPITRTLSARGAIQFSGMDGYTFNQFLGSHGPRLRDWIGRVSLRWEPNDTFQSDLRFDHASNRDTSTFNAEIEGCPPPAGFPSARGPCAAYLALRGPNIDNQLNFVADVGPSAFRLDLNEVAWTNRLDLGAVVINSISSYSFLRANTFINATPLPVRGTGGYFFSPFNQNERFKNYAQELRVESQGDGSLQYVFGAYYSHGDLVSNSYSSLFNSSTIGAAGAPVTSGATPIGTNRNLFQIDQTRSVFGQLTYDLTSKLHVNAGLRYTSVKKEASRLARVGIGGPEETAEQFMPLPAATQALLFPVTGLNNNPFADPETTYNKLLPSAGVQYNIVPTLTAYATYTNGFKAGGYSDSNGPAQFDSEFVDSYEIGLKGSALDRRLFFTLDAFYTSFKGLQVALSVIGPTGATITTVGNAATSVSKGVEGTLSFRASPWLSLNANFAYVDSHFSSYTNGGCTQAQIARPVIPNNPYNTGGGACVQDLSGRPTAFAPKFSSSAGFTVTAPVGVNELRVEPNLFYSTSYFLSAVDDPLVFQGNYAQFDTRVGFGPSDRSWEIALVGKNLSNAKVRNTSSTIGTSPGLSYALLQRARSIAVSVSIRR